MLPTLIVLDGHMMDHSLKLGDEKIFRSLKIHRKHECLGLTKQEWDELAQAVQIRGLTPTIRVGGAGANTARWFAHLGGQVQVHGQVGDDEQGQRVIDQLHTDRCEVRLRCVHGATGRCLVFVRPDGRRVMRFDVGVAMNFDDLDAVVASIQPGTWLHLTGYLLDSTHPIHHVAWEAMDAARCDHVPISMDIGSGSYLGDEVIWEVARKYTQVMFLNAKEARQLGLGTPHKAVRTLLYLARDIKDAVVVITQGERGVLVGRGNEIEQIPARSVPVLDTTGGGDAFAAGFLYALMQGSSLKACARVGCDLAASTIQVMGGVPEW